MRPGKVKIFSRRQPPLFVGLRNPALFFEIDQMREHRPPGRPLQPLVEALVHLRHHIGYRLRPLFEQPVVTEVALLQRYHRAEEYHQRFFEKNPAQGYCLAVAAPKVEKFRKVFAQWRK